MQLEFVIWLSLLFSLGVSALKADEFTNLALSGGQKEGAKSDKVRPHVEPQNMGMNEVENRPLAPAEKNERWMTVVLMGGYASCVPRHDKEFFAELKGQAVAARRNFGVQTKFILACFEGDVANLEDPPALRYEIWESSAEGTDFSRMRSGTIDPTPAEGPNYDAFVDLIANESDVGESNSTVLLGHSHGGGLALRIARKLPKKQKLGLIVTLDPKSFVACNPKTFTKEMVAGALNATAPLGKIRRPTKEAILKSFQGGQHQKAPEEPTEEISERVGGKENFLNFYQRASLSLSSGPLAGADNEELFEDWPKALSPKAHLAVKSDPHTLKKVRLSINNEARRLSQDH